MRIVLLSNDLMFSSRVQGAAARIGAAFSTVASNEVLLTELGQVDEGAAEAGKEQVGLLLVDLNAFRGSVAEWLAMFRAAARPPRTIVAYGPHVHADRLEEATSAGCDEVLTRGQFNAQLDTVLARWT